MQVLEQWESQQGQSSPSAPVLPYSAPFPTHHLHRASVPDSASEAVALAKPDPYELYEKSRAIFESRRKYQSSKRGWVPGIHALRDQIGEPADGAGRGGQPSCGTSATKPLPLLTYANVFRTAALLKSVLIVANGTSAEGFSVVVEQKVSR